jgi:hypothetical protein
VAAPPCGTADRRRGHGNRRRPVHMVRGHRQIQCRTGYLRPVQRGTDDSRVADAAPSGPAHGQAPDRGGRGRDRRLAPARPAYLADCVPHAPIRPESHSRLPPRWHSPSTCLVRRGWPATPVPGRRPPGA